MAKLVPYGVNVQEVKPDYIIRAEVNEALLSAGIPPEAAAAGAAAAAGERVHFPQKPKFNLNKIPESVIKGAQATAYSQQLAATTGYNPLFNPYSEVNQKMKGPRRYKKKTSSKPKSSKSGKRKPSRKQLAALAKGRKIRAKQLKSR